ncbi:hypothetical protein C492_14741 [Natronococcus jeotgali DSM 18795]|uniref:Uncharacterized protein n=1 Tax=Natronococcus jeotgali DSM 18795 TaxID=1227498 RepID=L9X6X6_9EURY|nr:hypothetical protein C492_14741 [Natronococcus jeotgali DSM 18795]
MKSRLAESLRRSRVRRTAGAIGAVDDPAARRLADGFRICLRDSFTADQRATFARISDRKSALQNDDSEVTYSFHGPSDEGVTEDVYDGRSSTVTVSEFPHCPSRYGTLLTALLTQYHSPSVVEFGTCLGTSAAYMGAGLDSGHLTTIEAGEPQVRIARETIEKLAWRTELPPDRGCSRTCSWRTVPRRTSTSRSSTATTRRTRRSSTSTRCTSSRTRTRSSRSTT